MPGGVARTSTLALNNATLPFGLAIANKGAEQALKDEKALREERHALSEAPLNATGNVQNYDPVLISLVRRAMPQLIAYDVAGVQPMTRVVVPPTNNFF